MWNFPAVFMVQKKFFRQNRHTRFAKNSDELLIYSDISRIPKGQGAAKRGQGALKQRARVIRFKRAHFQKRSGLNTAGFLAYFVFI